MHRSAAAVALSVILLLTTPALALEDAIYAALRAARPDGRTIALQGFRYEADVFTFTLDGRLHLLAAVDGKTPGAVFIGRGSVQLDPATDAEKRTLALSTGEKELTVLTETFDDAVFLGGALLTATEKAALPVEQAASPAAVDRWNDYLDWQKKKLRTNVHVRLLQELVDGAGPLLFAAFDGRNHPAAVAIVDPRGAEAVRMVGNLGGEQSMLYVDHDTKGGVWYSSRYRADIERGSGAIALPPADAHHYLINASIRGAELDATTTMTFSPNYDLRVLPIDLTASLDLSSAEYAVDGDSPEWTAIPFVQEEQESDAAVIFPAPLKKGEKYLLRTKYSGKEVLSNSGDGNFTVTRRTSWYPNVGVFNDLATYELRFRTPEKFSVIAIGDEIANEVKGNERVSVWKTPRPVRVAGFNYGRFKRFAEKDAENGTTFEVYANPGTPDVLREINMILRAATDAALHGDMEAGAIAGGEIRIDAAGLSKGAIVDGMNTVRTATAFFGPLPDRRIAMTQQSQWFFGQSWPTLIYLPYVAFLNGTQRNTLGLNDAKDFVDNIASHEIAHQWWGHQVGVHGYRDNWLSEGFSEFTSALVVQQTGGWAKYDAFWERARKAILDKPRGAMIANHEAGPISQGWRNSTWQNRVADDVLTYSKGAYVLHMLRMAMWDKQKGDTAFIAMMKDYAQTYAGKNPTTRDFQRIAEKHAPASLRLTSDEKLDWFFGQWVYRTAIPKYEIDVTARETSPGKYRLTGTISQSGVPDNFAMPVPVYVQFDKKTTVKMGSMVLVGNTSKPVDIEMPMPKKPQKFLVNAMHDILSR